MVRMCSCVYIYLQLFYKDLKPFAPSWSNALSGSFKKNVTIAASLEGFMFDYKLGCAARQMMLITNKRKN